MRRIALALLLAWSSAAIAGASPERAQTSSCTAAIATAEQTGSIPAGLLAAIGHVESGRPDPLTGVVQPWPWTIDVGGTGQFFATKTAAVAATRALEAEGVASIDVGCMQVNLAYHPAAFASLEEAFDPLANALYAARFLSALFKATGDWAAAAAAYHSQTRAIGAAYQDKVLALWTPPRSPYAADSRSPGFTAPNWFAAASRDARRRAAASDGNASTLGRAATAAPAPWIERVIAEIAGCPAAATARAMPAAAASPGAAAWKATTGPCPTSPFAEPAALRRLLAPVDAANRPGNELRDRDAE
jgi:Transglycosylase SLT domain